MHRDVGSHDADPSASVVHLEPNVIRRTIQVLRHLWTRRAEVHHVEIYVGGRFAFVHALLTRIDARMDCGYACF